MPDFQYIKLPDGSYGKFSADASDETIRGAVEKDFPEAFAPKLAAPAAPGALAGPKDPEFKPFLSGDEARDELSGLGKSITPIVAGAGSLLGKVPGIGKGIIDPQKVHDLEEYSKPANKGEQFGKISGSIAQALPAVATGGEFAGGLYDELAPALGPAVSAAGGALGKMAVKGAGKLATGALLGTGYEARHQIGDLLRKFF